MGNRIGRLCEDERTLGWVVYQSTTMVCYDPIFCTELAAHIFAYHYLVIKRPNMDRNYTEELAASIEDFVLDRFGEEPELLKSPNYNTYATLLHTVRADFSPNGPLHTIWREWHNASKLVPKKKPGTITVLLGCGRVTVADGKGVSSHGRVRR